MFLMFFLISRTEIDMLVFDSTLQEANIFLTSVLAPLKLSVLQLFNNFATSSFHKGIFYSDRYLDVDANNAHQSVDHMALFLVRLYGDKPE